MPVAMDTLLEQHGIWGVLLVIAAWVIYLDLRQRQAARRVQVEIDLGDSKIENARQRVEIDTQAMITRTYHDLSTEHRTLLQQMADVREKLGTQEGTIKTLSSDLERAQRDLESARSEADKFKKLASENEEAAEIVRGQINQLEQEVKDLKAQMSDYEARIETERKAKETAERKLRQEKAERETLLQSIQERIQEAVSPLNKRIAELENEVRERDATIAVLESKLGATSNENIVYKGERDVQASDGAGDSGDGGDVVADDDDGAGGAAG